MKRTVAAVASLVASFAISAARYESLNPVRQARSHAVGCCASVPPAPELPAAPLAPAYFNWRKSSIYGGSNEIQKNIIAKMVLGL